MEGLVDSRDLEREEKDTDLADKNSAVITVRKTYLINY
jgi:hypothetical protein